MRATASEPSRLCFGVFELDLTTGELRKAGTLIHLPPQPFKILALLASRPGQLVTREEIQQQIWGTETFVDFDHGLNFAIKKIREALGDEAETPRYVETLPRRGYRFIAPVDAHHPPIPSSERRGAVSEERNGAVADSPPDSGGGQGVVEIASLPHDVGAGLALPSAAQQAAPLQKRWTVTIIGGALAIVAVLLALNVGGMRDRFVGPGLAPARPAQGPALPKIESIAVLPLENLSGDKEQEYFADGMTEELITNLGKISALRVISRTSVMQYKGTKKTLPQIARELNVDAVVEGSVLHSGNRVRITANLLHAPTDRHLWADSYESDMGDVLILQGEVARAIAAEVKAKVTPDVQARLASVRPINPESYRLYLQGRYHFNRGGFAAVYKSISLFQQALEKDPDNALAWAGLAESYGRVAVSYASPKECKEWFAKARAAALKALEIDSSLAEAHTALGYVHVNGDWDWPAAERELKHAVELKPSDASARSQYAGYLSGMGRHEQAISEIRRAQELDPLSPRMLSMGGSIYSGAHRYDEAIEQSRRAVDLDPNNAVAHGGLALTYLVKGMAKEATTERETAARLGMSLSLDIDALVYAAAGRRGEARKLLARVKEHAKRGEMTPFAVAQFYVGLDDKQTALDWLEKAYDQHDPFMASLKVNVFFDPLRSEPRFQALLRRMNFPP